MKLLSRLDVNPLGDRQHRLGKAAKVSMQREKVAKEKSQSNVELPDHTRKKIHEVRNSRNIVSIGVNTPLLKRLVKYPQVIDIQEFSKIDMPKIKPEKRPERERFSKVMKMRHQGRKDRMVKKFRPMDLYIKPHSVEVPSIENWIEKNR